MLHLAQVLKQDNPQSTSLQLLAVQRTERLWEAIDSPITVICDRPSEDYATDLVLVELSDASEVEKILPIKDWILSLVTDYLSCGLSPVELSQEAERAEQWRQSLTLRSQELGRQALEMEARRDQIHELEQNLQQKLEEVEEHRNDLAHLHELERNFQQKLNDIEKQRQRLAQREQELEQRWDQLHQHEQRLNIHPQIDESPKLDCEIVADVDTESNHSS